MVNKYQLHTYHEASSIVNLEKGASEATHTFSNAHPIHYYTTYILLFFFFFFVRVSVNVFEGQHFSTTAVSLKPTGKMACGHNAALTFENSNKAPGRFASLRITDDTTYIVSCIPFMPLSLSCLEEAPRQFRGSLQIHEIVYHHV